MALISQRFYTGAGRVAFYILGIPLVMILPIVVGNNGSRGGALVTGFIGLLVTLLVSRAVDNASFRRRHGFTPPDPEDLEGLARQDSTHPTSTGYGARWKCPKCWIMNPGDASRCVNCGFEPR